MSYFKLHPFIEYPFENSDILIQNITKRTDFLDQYRKNREYSIEYSIKDGETPEIISDRFYGDITDFWIILLYNNINDIWCEWPLSSSELNQSTLEKYGDEIDGIHHIESLLGKNIVTLDHEAHDRIIITNREYEEKLNESKRNIRLLLPELVESVKRQHYRLVQE